MDSTVAAAATAAAQPTAATTTQVPSTASGAAGAVRRNLASASRYEARYGYSRAVRRGPLVFVAGTTSTDPASGGVVFPGDAYRQAQQAFANARRALEALGATAADVVRTRMYVVDITRDADAVGLAHAEAFVLDSAGAGETDTASVGRAMPAATMVQVSALIDPLMLVEVEVDAVCCSNGFGGDVL
ncbi:hypothetical protein HK405_012223 [Cladochytrium tenue]|nr:hypothetical protein HK405_012223 [Cladochytrium tenue]